MGITAIIHYKFAHILKNILKMQILHDLKVNFAYKSWLKGI
jgi:hypothetical protein